MLLLSRSVRRKLLATALSAVTILLLYQATVIDSRKASAAGTTTELTYVAPQPGARLSFEATAYCKGLTTASGVNVRAGIAAADPKVLPIGSVVQVSGVPERHRGIYTVLDTGPEIQGRELDLYMWSCNEALAFGRRHVELMVLRLGWNQANSAPAHR
jgi:3D (Asp-Asp-Asp) domain-containing protein